MPDRSAALAPPIAVAACIGVAVAMCGCYGPPPHARGMAPEAPPMLHGNGSSQDQEPLEVQPASSQQYASPPPSEVVH